MTRLTKDGSFGNVHALANGGAVATMNSILAPDDLYRIAKGKVTQITAVNKELLSELDPVKLNKFSFTGANNDTVWGYAVKPASLKGGKAPIAFIVHDRHHHQ